MTRSPQPYLLQIGLATVASALAFGLGAGLDQALYEHWIVPILPTVNSVPLSLWAVTLTPGFSLVLGTVIISRSLGALALAAISGGLARHLALTRFAMEGRLNTAKSFALEDPDHWWTTHLIWTIVSVAVYLILTRLLIRLGQYAHRRRRSRLAQSQ